MSPILQFPDQQRPKPITTTDEYYVVRGKNGKYAIDTAPDTLNEHPVNYQFLVDLNAADQFAEFDQATCAVDSMDHSDFPIIQKVRRTSTVEVIE